MKKFYLLFLLMLLPLMASADEKEAYAVLSDNNTMLTFYYDDQKAARNGMDIGPFSGYPDFQSWYAQRESITSVVFDDSFANCTTLTSTAYWFYFLENLSSITGISNLKTDNVMDMSGMFRECRGLTSLDVSNFKTDNVTKMGQMFNSCSGLTSLDVTGFNTEFSGCSGLTSLDVTGFNTDNVWNMESMFYGCSGLTSLDVSNFKTDNVWSMNFMFAFCSGLTSLDVTNFKTDNVMDMGGMFNSCSGLTSLDVSNFKTDKVTDMMYMFIDCSSLTSLDVTNFKTDNVTNMRAMFNRCSGLTSLDVTGFKTDNVTNMSGMFSNCTGLTSLDVTNFKTDNVTDMMYMFAGCSSLKTIYTGDGWSTAKVQTSEKMFEGCTSLVGGAGTTYSADHTEHTYAHIDGGASNPGYFTAKGGGGESPTEETEETEEVIKITSAGQTTWCSASDLDFTGVEGLKAYIAPGYNRTTGTIWLMRVFEVPANEGILLIGDPGEYKVPKKSTTTYYKNMFKGTLEPITINETEGEYTNYYLSNGTSGVGFYKVDGTQKTEDRSQSCLLAFAEGNDSVWYPLHWY